MPLIGVVCSGAHGSPPPPVLQGTVHPLADPLFFLISLAPGSIEETTVNMHLRGGAVE